MCTDTASMGAKTERYKCSICGHEPSCDHLPGPGKIWPRPWTADELEKMRARVSPLAFQQQYMGEPFDPNELFKDDCVCGHSKADHTRAHSGHVGRCMGTRHENCDCRMYRRKPDEPEG